MPEFTVWPASVGGLLLALLLALPAGAEEKVGLDTVLAKDAAVEKVAADLRFTEGPVWKGDRLLFSDIPADTIYAYSPGRSKPEVFRLPSGQSNGLTLDHDGRLIACEHKNRRVSRTEKDGMVVTLAYAYEGKRLNSTNDVVVKSDGTIYFTYPPYGINKTQEELGFYGVYRIGRDGSLTLLVRDFVRPNGLAFSPDEKRLYVNDSQEGHIRVFDVQADGTLTKGHVFAEMKEPAQRGVPDGMKVDTAGNVYCTGPGGVWVFTPDGALRGKIAMPEVSANVGFGGRDYKTLFITASTGLYRIRLKNAGIRPGVRR